MARGATGAYFLWLVYCVGQNGYDGRLFKLKTESVPLKMGREGVLILRVHVAHSLIVISTPVLYTPLQLISLPVCLPRPFPSLSISTTGKKLQWGRPYGEVSNKYRQERVSHLFLLMEQSDTTLLPHVSRRSHGIKKWLATATPSVAAAD